MLTTKSWISQVLSWVGIYAILYTIVYSLHKGGNLPRTMQEVLGWSLHSPPGQTTCALNYHPAVPPCDAKMAG